MPRTRARIWTACLPSSCACESWSGVARTLKLFLSTCSTYFTPSFCSAPTAAVLSSRALRLATGREKSAACVTHVRCSGVRLSHVFWLTHGGGLVMLVLQHHVVAVLRDLDEPGLERGIRLPERQVDGHRLVGTEEGVLRL